MKALHVNTHINMGGIGQYIVSIARAVKSKGVDCVVASSGGALEEELKKSGIKHIEVDLNTKFEFSPKVFKAASSLADIIKKEKIDIIHAHTRVSQFSAALASRKTLVPYISTCHGFFKPRLSRKLFDAWGKRVIAISDAVAAHLAEDFNVDKSRIRMIYTGIDINRFSKRYSPEELNEAKRSLGLKEGPVIGTMGRLSPVKGQRFLIEAMKYIISEKRGAECLIIGGGDLEGALKSLAKSLNIAGSINFIGSKYNDVPLYLSCMDVFALPSVKEGLGLALLEAMAAGRPCVASDIGGVRDIINDGVNGLLVPVGDAKAIARAALKLLDDKTLSEKIVCEAREKVKENFLIDKMADKVINLYREVVDESKNK